MSQGGADPIDAARKFNDAVEATAVIGGLSAKVEAIDKRTEQTARDVKHIRSSIDRWGGVAVVVSTLISVATGVVVWVAGNAIVHFAGF